MHDWVHCVGSSTYRSICTRTPVAKASTDQMPIVYAQTGLIGLLIISVLAHTVAGSEVKRSFGWTPDQVMSWESIKG